ncbi:MAG TPA: AraC family transcriptional regulator [Roseiflexaceae bacterium]|nr:AraC family transcriptional regulator [Roseiflexaceae bacterium]
MARFRNNEHQILIAPVVQRDGLKIERVQRFDQTALLPELDRWRAWSFRITLSGTRYITYRDQAYSLAPNTILWHSPLKDLVKTRCLPGTGSDSAILTFTAQRWGDFERRYPAFREHNAALACDAPERPLLALQTAPPQLLHVLRQLIVLSQTPKGAREGLALENACGLLLRLIGELRFGAAGASQEPERRERVELAQARMVARLARPPSLSQIAADLNLSPRQLQRDFVACTGLTPIRYLNVVRMSEANSLLAETSIPIAEIAALLGYASQAHFSTAFRQAYDCSPSEVRKFEG